MLTAHDDGAIPLDSQLEGTGGLTAKKTAWLQQQVRGQTAVYPLLFDRELKCDSKFQQSFETAMATQGRLLHTQDLEVHLAPDYHLLHLNKIWVEFSFESKHYY